MMLFLDTLSTQTQSMVVKYNANNLKQLVSSIRFSIENCNELKNFLTNSNILATDITPTVFEAACYFFDIVGEYQPNNRFDPFCKLLGDIETLQNTKINFVFFQQYVHTAQMLGSPQPSDLSHPPAAGISAETRLQQGITNPPEQKTMLVQFPRPITSTHKTFFKHPLQQAGDLKNENHHAKDKKKKRSQQSCASSSMH